MGNNITVQHEVITPEIAAALLAKNIKNNRPLKRTKIVQYARFMANGLWDEANGETIKISDTGFVIDGQNRLTAVIESKTPCTFLVVRGVKESSMTSIDMGAARTVGDQLHFSGIPNARITATAIQMYYDLKCGVTGALSNTVTKGSGRNTSPGVKYAAYSKTHKLHPDEIKSMYLERAELWGHFIGMARSKKIMVDSITNTAAVWAYFYDLNPEAAETFMRSLMTGEGLELNDPILTLRNKLIMAKTSKMHYMTARDRFSVYISAWNAYRSGRKLARITLPENVPTPIK